MTYYRELTDADEIRAWSMAGLLFVGYPATWWQDEVSLDQIKDWKADGTVFLLSVED